MPEATPQPGSARKAYPMLGIAGVLLGALIATFLGRLMSVGIGDLRGALHPNYDDATWITTSYNMGTMFIGPFSVFLGGLLGPRRVLLTRAGAFTAICIFLQQREQFHSNMLGLHVQAGSATASERLQSLTMGMQAQAPSPDVAVARASTLLGLSIRKQAFTLATIDCFLLIALSCVVCLVVVACIGSLNIQYKHVLASIKAQRA